MILPPLEGLRENGAEVPGFSTAELKRGEVTAVNFFASWCAPCVQEHPLLMALKQDTGLRIYGVNYKDPSPGGRRFIGRYGNPYAAVGVDADGRAAIEWGVYGMPETFIVDGEGRIVWKHVGPITPEALQSQILPAVRAAGGKAAAAE
jgi:cytochrome c biogenesis protein CcmG/thiol:disulfide interchange protein DsbE